MNKIIVVGHPQSGWERLYELLLDCGMAQALPSLREGFTPQQIGATLLKAHGAVPVQQLCSADELQQIAVAPVWQGLALDLVLANMEQPLWGWADVQAVYLLDYWKAQDPQTMFVLVYDAPQTALIRHAVEHLETDPDALQAKVNAWVSYNSALLSFHLRNPERSLLVHADQVQASATHYVQQLSARMGAQLQLPGTSVNDVGTQDTTPSVLQAEAAASPNMHAYGHPAVQPALQGNALAQWLAQQLLQEHPEAQELYSQLQAAASMPLRVLQPGTSLLAGHDLQQQHYQAWAAFVAQQTAMQQSAARLVQLGTTLQGRQQQLQNCEHENALLMAQLHKVQEMLESHYQQSQQQAKQLAELPKLQADLKSAQEKVAKLQQAAAKPASTELQEENGLLLSQLHKVQEELERYYLENRQLKSGGAKLKSQSKQTYYGAADRVKQQLSYRLGATMIRQSRSIGGWLNMPFALSAETKLFRQDLAARKDMKLPSIAQYQDAHEAELIKQHLSYRLGSRLLNSSKTLGGMISLPWSLYAEVKAFRKDRQSR
jgi:hypothetical protein